MLFCGTFWSYTTRLLKTPIVGRTAAAVDSSRGDMLAGLSKWEILSTPPAFCATAASAANNQTTVNPPPPAPADLASSLDLPSCSMSRARGPLPTTSGGYHKLRDGV